MGHQPLWDKRRCPHCDKYAFWELHYNGKASCTACGVLCDSWAFEGFQTSYAHGYSPVNSLQQNQVYTRTKRFLKYLNRASMKQSVNGGLRPQRGAAVLQLSCTH